MASGSSSLVEPRGACSPTAPVPPVGPWAGVDGELGQEALAPPSPGLGHSSRASREEVIAFSGIPDPVSEGRRLSSRLQDHPEVDDIQQRCAMRAAKLRDVEVTTGMSVNTSNSILHFSNDEIINNANKLGISLGSNDSEISNLVNDLLDLEAERALEMIRNLAAVKPTNNSEIDALGVRVLDNLCADLVPEEEEERVDFVEVRASETGCEDQLESFNMPKRKWKRKIYPASAVRRSERIRTAKKFHDEL